jgi:N-acetylglucosaminyl-diphospho-decaprenol L-rhamnosyltransferase
MSLPSPPPDPGLPSLTVIIVSYNTRDLTLAALRTLYETTHTTRFQAIVFDNASADGSADAVETAFPQVTLVRSPSNLGFAKANNLAAGMVQTDWLLLLNPDTECHSGAVDNLMACAIRNPQAGIYGGRTVFPDGQLNIASCWMRITPWSVFCASTGLTAAFPKSPAFNPEAMGSWLRDSVRQVDIVSGCFLLIHGPLWRRLGGFDLRYFMYGEEADLCLRARRLGHSPLITPEAQIMHLVGASSTDKADKRCMVLKARSTLIRDHWPAWQAPLGLGLVWAGIGARMLSAKILALTGKSRAMERARYWSDIWRNRQSWIKGYVQECRDSEPPPT